MKLCKGDSVWLDWADDGPSSGGWVTWDGRAWVAPCGGRFTPARLRQEMRWRENGCSDCRVENLSADEIRMNHDLNYLYIAEQLIGDGSMK